MTLLTLVADHRAAVDMDRKVAAPAADAMCSNRSISPACRAHSSKPTTCCGTRWDRQTDRYCIITQTLPYTMQAVSINNRGLQATCPMYHLTNSIKALKRIQ